MAQAELYPILTYRDESSRSRIAEKMRPFAGRYEALYFDFAELASLDSLFHQIDDDLDFLVDFAQGNMESLVASANGADTCTFFSENVSARAEVLKRTSRAMLKKRQGRLVFISSSAAARPNPGQGFYAAAKLASEALYRNLGLELGSRGITTVTLRPGYIKAGRGRQYIQSNEGELLRKVPISRALRAKEVVEAILFFLSDSARGFNATEIAMDGGLTAGK
jgi:3-oxoacyl-[acyl-carrier protein] reductase